MRKGIATTLAVTSLALGGCIEQPVSVRDSQDPAAQLSVAPAGDYVRTPAGWWHRSCVHEIPEGAHLARDGRVTRGDGTTYQLPDCTYVSYPTRRNIRADSVLPPTVNGHLEFAYEDAPSNNSWRSIEAKWVVASKPTASYDLYEVYYTFPGLQSQEEGDNVILQPVLQYGYNGGFGCISCWYAASWRCDERPGGTCGHSSPFSVSVGDSIYGLIQSEACYGGICSWSVITLDMTTNIRSTLSFDDPDDLYTLAIGGDVEVYNLDTCNHFPTNGVFYSGITLLDEGGPTVPSWSHYIQPGASPSCEYDVSSTASTVDLYHNIPAPPPPLTANIGGPDKIQPDVQCVWQGIGSGGSVPYSYHWWGANSGSSEFLWGSLAQSSYQWLEITDAVGAKDTAQILIRVDEGYPECEA